MVSILQPGSFQFAYSPPSAEVTELTRAIGGMTGIEAILHILRAKKRHQEGKVDVGIYTLVAGTGAGKTTAMVKFLFDARIRGKRGRKTILCTQPKVGLARTQPTAVASMFPDVRVGRELGYRTGGGTLIPTSEQNVVYCTTQILTNEISSLPPDRFGARYPIVVIDEAHDQSMEMLLALRNAMEYVQSYYREKWCTLFIVTSATIEPLKYVQYFGADPNSPYNTGFIAGRTRFPIEERYLSPSETAKEKAVAIAADIALELVETIIERDDRLRQDSDAPADAHSSHTDILAFWTSGAEIAKYLEAAKAKIEPFLATRGGKRNGKKGEDNGKKSEGNGGKGEGNGKKGRGEKSSEEKGRGEKSSEEKGSGEKSDEEGREEKREGSGEKGSGEKGSGEKEGAWKVHYISYTRLDPINNTEGFQLLFRRQEPREIKVVGATNVVEAGATLVNLFASMDCARQLTTVQFPLAGRSQMLALPISEFSRIQRRGRVGRTGKGLYIGLYDVAAKEAMHLTPPESTLVSADIPIRIYTLITMQTMKRYRAIVGDLGAIARILLLKRARFPLPSMDIGSDLRLLTPVSIDSCIHSMQRLTSLGLIEWDGSLSAVGLQVSAFPISTIGEAFLRSHLMAQLINPLDIDLFCRVLSDSLMRAELANEIKWQETITKYYPDAKFSFKDPVPTSKDALAVFSIAQTCLEALANGKTTFPVPKHPKWGAINEGMIRETVYAALDAIEGEGAFYTPPFVDQDSRQRAESMHIYAHALVQASRRIQGTRESAAVTTKPAKILF